MGDTLTTAPCTLQFDAIGTGWKIETDRPMDGPLGEGILRRVEQFDATYSRFRRRARIAEAALADRHAGVTRVAYAGR